MRSRRFYSYALMVSSMVLVLYLLSNMIRDSIYLSNLESQPQQPDESDERGRPPYFRPQPQWTPPPIQDPFPSLQTSPPPLVPKWNQPKPDIHLQYGLNYKPPLLIGFTRNWPMLLQCVVSYITAGWPADQIYVIENTGVQLANANGKLTLQNPLYLNHTQLKTLSVNIIRIPVLMSFAQLQNFYIHLSLENSWPYYFWSHMDVIALSYEDGNEFTPPAMHPGYKTIYELCLTEMQRILNSDERWAALFFAYDHLTLVNREAYEEVGGWDTMIPYYITDCDMHSRLPMHNWTIKDVHAGHVTDVGSALEDLRALYRDPSVKVHFIDSNPPPPEPDSDEPNEEPKDLEDATIDLPADNTDAPDLAYWRKLWLASDKMYHHKHRDRNTWQTGQRGGFGEPYYYNARGIAEGIGVLTDAGREVFRRKWGHKDCNILGATDLKLEDQWLVQKDWED